MELVDHVRVNPSLGKRQRHASTICADDSTQDVLKVTPEYDGLKIHGNVTKTSSRPEHISYVESITVIGEFPYFSASSSYAEQGGLFRCSLETGEVLSVLSNSTLRI